MLIKILIIFTLGILLISCATSYETKDGRKFRVELTGNMGDYLEAGRSFSK